jgi:hypothetical protein
MAANLYCVGLCSGQCCSDRTANTKHAVDLNGYSLDAAADLLTHITANKVECDISIHEGESSLVQLADHPSGN